MALSIGLNILQLAFVAALSPLFAGVAARWRQNVAFRRGPSIWQPYRDLRKLFTKEQLRSETRTWISRLAPYAACIAPMLVALIVPVLTDFPLFGSFAGDMLAIGFILAFGGFFIAIAAIESGNPYGAMGASRANMVSFLAQPALIVVLFAVSFVANSAVPYVVQQQWLASPAHFFSPAHVLVLVAFFMLIIAETGSLPIDDPEGHVELAMIGESQLLDLSGRAYALVKWGGAMKSTVLAVIFVNVLVAPWGLASSASPSALALAIVWVTVKILILQVLLVGVEASLAKLRLFRISEYLGAAFVIAVTAMVAAVFGSS